MKHRIIAPLLIVPLLWAPTHARADWNSIDSPAFLTDGNPAFIADSVKAGNVFQYLSGGLMLGLIAYHADLKGLEQGLLTYTATLGTNTLLKYSFGRQRPNGATDYLSFPSGHTAATMGPAAFVTVRYGFWESIPFWGIGIFTAYSRVAGRAHFITDTMGATALSLFFAYLFTTPLADERRGEEKTKLFFTPQIYDQGGMGLGVSLQF